jgi:hypothetical protein
VTTELYEPLIERDLDAFPAAAHAFLESHSAEELWVAVTRFAVLAYAPSQHSKRAVMACLAAHDHLDLDMIVECARYAAESRQPWSEPPILDPPEPSSGELDELRAAMREGDRLRAERWLSARLDDAEVALREVVHCDALLMLDTATALLPLLGEKGRYALLRMAVWELVADPDAREEEAPLATLVARAVEADGAPDAVSAVFYATTVPSPRGEAVGRGWREAPGEGTSHLRGATPHPNPLLASTRGERPLVPYRLARDYAQTLIAHHYASRLPPELAQQLLHAVRYNLEHGESFADWSFA